MHGSIFCSYIAALALCALPIINAAPVADKRLYILPPQPTKRYFLHEPVSTIIADAATVTETPVKREAMFLVDTGDAVTTVATTLAAVEADVAYFV